MLALTLAGVACLRAGSNPILAQTPKLTPLPAPIVLSAQRTGGWGTGLLTEFTVSGIGRFTWRQRLNPASNEQPKWEVLSGQLSRSEWDGLLRRLEQAGPGPQADDAGEVVFRWRDPKAQEQQKSYSRPSAAPAADLLKMIETLARRNSKS